MRVRVLQVPISAGQGMEFDTPEGWTPISAVPTLLPVQRSALEAGPPQMAPVLVVTLVPEQGAGSINGVPTFNPAEA